MTIKTENETAPLLFDNLHQIRNFHGYYQFRETTNESWQFIITGFCYNDIHCHVLSFDKKEIKVPINDKDEIIIRGRKYGRENWYH